MCLFYQYCWVAGKQTALASETIFPFNDQNLFHIYIYGGSGHIPVVIVSESDSTLSDTNCTIQFSVAHRILVYLSRDEFCKKLRDNLCAEEICVPNVYKCSLSNVNIRHSSPSLFFFIHPISSTLF